MTKKRIIAYFMHETEEHAANEKMKNVEGTQSYLLGEIDEVDIPYLREQGLIIQELEDLPKEETPGKIPHPRMRRLKMKRGRRAAAARPRIDRTKPNFYLIRLIGPLLGHWRGQIEQLDVKLLEYIPHYSYTAKLTSDQVKEINKLPFVRKVRIYGPEDTGLILKSAAAPPTAGLNMLTYDIHLHRKEDLDLVRDWLQNHDVNIAGASGRKIRFYLLEKSPLAFDIAALPEVSRGPEEYVPPKLHNDIARTILGIDRSAHPNLEINIQQTGEGQIVAVADTGLDKNHPDFQGRIFKCIALGRPGNSSDPDGHGTHVAGSVLGNGSASGGKIRGIAPKAKLFFQSLLDANGGLGGLPLDLGDLFKKPYKAGARIHNNSWGSATNSMYTINSIEVDEFVAKHRDMLIVFSAGNEGQAANRLNSQLGYVDWLSMDSPASSKNSLTVGASRSPRTQGGYSQLTYGQAWPEDFPDPPIATENVSGDPDRIAAFSSRGPCDDRRIKPDVVAPGTDIVSTKSSSAPLHNYWGSFPRNDYYTFMGGTSMAAPLVSGCAALVREYYIKSRNHKPSAALLKATLINGTKWLTGPDAKADHPSLPNYHQGFGSIYMPWTIPNPSEPNLKLEFLDTWKDPQMQFVQSGDSYRRQFFISGGKRLRICLAWTDPPGRALQNNLNLIVEHKQTKKKWMGNEDLPMSLKIPDPDNNVEVVRFENPLAGKYIIQISAPNMLHAPQDFALVVTGDLDSPLEDYRPDPP